LSYDREVDIPFDVLRLDDFTYVVPHGLPIKTEPLIRAGVDRISLVNRNVTVGVANAEDITEEYVSHPLFPADEYLQVKATPPMLVRFSNKLLEVLGITIEVIYDYFSEANQRILNVEPSQLSIARGKLVIGEIPSEPMMIVWTGATFVVSPTSTKLVPPEVAVEEVEGSIAGSQFRCKYGMLDIVRR
jgi:hypothetical protein